MSTYYTLDAVNHLIKQYEERGGLCATVQEGVLGYGITILYGLGLKMAVITEVPLNEWSSGHKIRLYNVPPRKYLDMLKKYEEEL